MSRKISMLVVAGMAIGLGGIASAQTLKTDSNLDLARAYRAEIKADTARRVSELANGRSGFQVVGADGIGTLNVGALLQFRYTAGFREEDSRVFTNGFANTNTNLVTFATAGAANRNQAAVDLVTAPGTRLLNTSPLFTQNVFAVAADNTTDDVFNPTGTFINIPAGVVDDFIVANPGVNPAFIRPVADSAVGVGAATQAGLNAQAVDVSDPFDFDDDGNLAEADGIVDINNLGGFGGADTNIGLLNGQLLAGTLNAGSTFADLSAEQRLALREGLRQSYVRDLRRDFEDGTLSQRIEDNDFAHGFNVQRARLDFYGNVVIPNFTYRISGEFSDVIEGGNSGGDLNVTWAYGQYNFEGGLEGLYARVGIFKAPLFYEELVQPEYQLLAERSITNEFFSQQYSEGLMFGYEADAFRVNFAITDGLATRGTQYNGAGEADVALTGRVDVKFAGDWAQFEDFTSWRGSEFAARAGAAIHWETFGDTAPDDVGSAGATLPTLYRILALPTGPDGNIIDNGDLVSYTADVQFEGNGWNAFAAFFGRYEQADIGNPNAQIIRDLIGIEEDINDFGATVQAGYLVTDQVELFARYEGIYLDEDRFGILDDALGLENDVHFLTVGGTYYFTPESHALKWVTDVVISFSDTRILQLTPNGANRTVLSGNSSNTVTGLLGSDDDTEVLLRSQFQLLF